jgi:hypothetical protein
LSREEPFAKEDFYSTLQQKNIMDENKDNYETYLKEASKFKTRWDYLKFYNIRDVEAMISPIDNIIALNWKYGIDTLLNLSLSANASSIKYALAYKDFDINKNYTPELKEPPFNFTKPWFERKCTQYLEQDKKAKRDTLDIITGVDFEFMLALYHQSGRQCYICGQKFTSPTHQLKLWKLPVPIYQI